MSIGRILEVGQEAAHHVFFGAATGAVIGFAWLLAWSWLLS
jgi:hypothetical protein